MSRIIENFVRSGARARVPALRRWLRTRGAVPVALALAIAAPAVAVVLGSGCGGGGGGSRDAAIPRDAQRISAMGETSLSDTTSEFPRLRFADGQTSLNDRCIVRQAKLNPRLPAIYVNGRPIGFC